MAITPDILSKELLVATEIYRLEQANEGPVYFNRLFEELKGAGYVGSRTTVSRALDILFDQGMVKGAWVTRPADGKHVRALTIAGEARDFVKGIFERVRVGQ